MREDPGLGAREPDPVDDRGVVEGVGHHHVAFPNERGDDAEVGRISGVEAERRLGAHEACQLRLQLFVEIEVSADEARAPGRAAPLLDRVRGRAHDLGVMTEVEVIAAREDEELAAIDDRARSLGPG